VAFFAFRQWHESGLGENLDGAGGPMIEEIFCPALDKIALT
jgi:hypothetical protein